MVKLGMVGYNEGNGHPYSFSAIINGYDSNEMAKSPYPVISNYLSERDKNEFGIGEYKVTHIWTPNISLSKNIANCTYIPNIVSNYEDLVGNVDAIIIARDDVESHYSLVKFFLEEGLSVFVDKPLCNSKEHLNYFMPFIESAQLMSCSGLRYHPDIISCFDGKLKKEEICFVNTFSVLDWMKYGIHVLEAITPIMGYNIKEIRSLNDPNNILAKIIYESGQYVLIQINKHCMNPISAEFYTFNSSFKTVFNKNFICFKNMLLKFTQMLETKKAPIHPEETYAIVETIIKGNNA